MKETRRKERREKTIITVFGCEGGKVKGGDAKLDLTE